MFLRSSFLALAAFVLAPGIAHAARSYDNCTGFIDSLPATISSQGTWCLRQNLSTGMTSGVAIAIATNNVTIDCNDFKVGNLAAGTGTLAHGVSTEKAINVTVRHCKFRGFLEPVHLVAPVASGNYRVERNHVQGATSVGLRVVGNGSVVRGNTVTDIGGSTAVIDGPIGIHTTRVVDVIDNTVTNVAGEYSVTGILVDGNTGGSIRGNRIRGLVSRISGANGILLGGVGGSSRAILRENDISTPGGRTGISCQDTSIRALDNNIAGFETALDLCGNGGGNDVSP